MFLLVLLRKLPLATSKKVLLGGFTLLLAVGPLARYASAQRPFDIYDPFYRSETAQRTFFDGYALTAEISYRRAGELQQTRLPVEGDDHPLEYQTATTSDPLGLSFHLDYQLASQFDLRAILDASSGPTGRRITLSWLALKYYRHIEQADYALRFAVDPTPDGRPGFPQVDGAFIYTSMFSPAVSSNFAIGMRRVHIGYEKLLVPEAPSSESVSTLQQRLFHVDSLTASSSVPTSVHRRAIGWELHAMLNYNFHFDPAGSNLFVALFGDLSSYDLLELQREHLPSSPADEESAATYGADNTSPQPISPWSSTYRGGVIWLRSGISFDRPSYRAVPFLALPLRQWMPDEGPWQQAAPHVGLQLMLR